MVKTRKIPKPNYWKTYKHGIPSLSANSKWSNYLQLSYKGQICKGTGTYPSKLDAVKARLAFERKYYGAEYEKNSPSRRYFMLAQHYLPYQEIYHAYERQEYYAMHRLRTMNEM